MLLLVGDVQRSLKRKSDTGVGFYLNVLNYDYHINGQVTVLSCMDVLLRMRLLLVWVLLCWMVFMLRNMLWLLLELL